MFLAYIIYTEKKHIFLFSTPQWSKPTGEGSKCSLTESKVLLPTEKGQKAIEFDKSPDPTNSSGLSRFRRTLIKNIDFQQY